MYDFFLFDTQVKRIGREDVLIISPDFDVNLRTEDLMVRGGDFYAVWDEDEGLWSTNEQTVTDKVDSILKERKREEEENPSCRFDRIVVRTMRRSSTKMIDRWHKFVKDQMRDTYHPLDKTITFSNTEVKKSDYVSKRLGYPLKKGNTPAYDELVSTLYDPDERRKLEWIIGAIISGDSRHIQKFGVLYGAPGSGKSTFLKIIEKLFKGYTISFSAKSMGSKNNDFALDSFKNDPLVAIDSEAKLSKIEDNTMLNSVVSHDAIEVNPKYGKKFNSRFEAFLLMATNEPVKITDAKSGLLRRLIDINPSGRKVQPYKKYLKLTQQVEYELGGIAWHCLEVYKELGEDYYGDYVPRQMMALTNDFYDFMDSNYDDFSRRDVITETEIWKRYKDYCDFAGVYQQSLRAVRQEIKNYFKNFEERGVIDGKRVRRMYSGFRTDRFTDSEPKEEKTEEPEEPEESWLKFDCTKSLFDEQFSDWKAQYEVDYGKGVQPEVSWRKCKTRLCDIDTSRVHYVHLADGIVLIMIDFDIPNENGEKDFELNLAAASKYPPTYAELSKSGGGIHLYYFWDGDPSELSNVAAPHVEIKTFPGDSAIRRKLTKCNDIPIATLSSGLPKKKRKESKVLDGKTFRSERQLRKKIATCLVKGYLKVPSTTENIHFIRDMLEDAYNSGQKYNVTDMREDIKWFAEHSSHQKEHCIDVVGEMKFKSDDKEEVTSNAVENDIPKIVIDTEIYRPDPETGNEGLFLVCYKELGTDLVPESVTALINPKPHEIEELFKYGHIGFNNLEYDCYMLWAASMGQGNQELYDLSQNIITYHRQDVKTYKAKEMVYVDVYDICKAAGEGMGLKKWEIKLQKEGKLPESVIHKEMGIPWDQPAPKDRWDEIIGYCKNDVLATEVVYWETQPFLAARLLQVDLVHALHGKNVRAFPRDTANTLSKRIIFGSERKPQYAFNYRDLSKPVGSDQYREYRDKFGPDYKFRVWNEKGLPEYQDYIEGMNLPDGYSILAFFPGYTFDQFAPKGKKSFFMDDYGGEGGRIFSAPGLYEDVWDGDIASQYPHSIMAEMLFGPDYTKTFSEIVKARIAVKHKDFDTAGKLLNGALKPYLKEETAKDLAQALKIVINSIYGLTSASFENEFKDPRNKDNIVAKRGNLFMMVLKNQIEQMGYEVCHIKTDSIKIPNADEKVKEFVLKFGREYGYEFETEAEFKKFVLLNDAAYVGRCKDGSWAFKADQFKPSFLQKMLFTKEKIVFEDYCQTFSVQQGAIYLDKNEDLEDVTQLEKRFDYLDRKLKKEEVPKGFDNLDQVEKEMGELDARIRAGHQLEFIGRVGQFVPVVDGVGGGPLYRVHEGRRFALSGTSGYKWLEAETVKLYGWQDKVDLGYFRAICDETVDDINKVSAPASFDYLMSE